MDRIRSKKSISNVIESKIDDYVDKHVFGNNLNVHNTIDVNEVIIGWYIDEYNNPLPSVIHQEDILVSSEHQLKPQKLNPKFLDILY